MDTGHGHRWRRAPGGEVRVAVSRLEDVLNAVAVMHVPIKDHHARDAELTARRRRRHAHVVQQAEAHRLRMLAVMAGRPDDGERVAQLAVAHARGELDDGAGGEEGGAPGVRRRKVRVGVETESRARPLFPKTLSG